jgi:hypothetical protein
MYHQMEVENVLLVKIILRLRKNLTVQIAPPTKVSVPSLTYPKIIQSPAITTKNSSAFLHHMLNLTIY